jgi:hypothetical protein
VSQVHGAVDRRRMSARAHRCLPVLSREHEEDEAEPEAGSPKHERRRDGDGRWRRKTHDVRALEWGDLVQWWSGVLEGLYKGPGEHRGGVTANG